FRRQAAGLDGRNAQVGVPEEVLHRPGDGPIDTGVDGERREQYGDAEPNASNRQDRPESSFRDAPPGERRQSAHASEPQLGEPADEWGGVVSIAAAETDLVADSAVRDHEHAVGV